MFGGDEKNKHKKMVNVYGILERLITGDGTKKAVDAVLNDHKIINPDQLLDLIPIECIKNM